MRILLLDRDTEYSKRVKYYFCKKYTNMQLSVSDNLKDAVSMMQDEHYDVALVDISFAEELNFDDPDSAFRHVAFAYLSETDEIIEGKETIVKYLGISELYTAICTLYEKKKKRVVKQDDSRTITQRGTEIITFLPVHGGAGSSTMAAACALDLAKEHRVLYLNLEQRSSDPVFFSATEKSSISDVLSTLRTKYTDAGLLQTLNSIIQEDKKQKAAKLFYIKGYANIMDCMAMTEQNIAILLKLIREKLDFRYVVVDADFIVSPVLSKLITSSDSVVFVTSGADVANTKLGRIQRYLDVLARGEDVEMPDSFLLLNQYYGMNDEQKIVRDMEILARIARYRTNENVRITSQDVIDVVLSKQEVFAKLRSDDTE